MNLAHEIADRDADWENLVAEEWGMMEVAKDIVDPLGEQSS